MLLCEGGLAQDVTVDVGLYHNAVSTDVLVADWWENELAGLPKKQRRVKAALLMYTAWNLWKERNRRIFEHVNSDAVRVMQEIKAEVAVRWLACGRPELTHD